MKSALEPGAYSSHAAALEVGSSMVLNTANGIPLAQDSEASDAIRQNKTQATVGIAPEPEAGPAATTAAFRLIELLAGETPSHAKHIHVRERQQDSLYE